MTLHKPVGQPVPSSPTSPGASRRTRLGISACGVLAALALSLYLLNGGVATSQDSGGTPEASPMASPQADDPRITIEFTELNDSGVTGTATLYASGDRTIVELELEGMGEDHPAHIHEGTCDDIQPEPAYTLENAGEAGASTSLADVPLNDLIDGDYVVDLHLAANQLGTLILCAGIDGDPTNASGTPVAIGGQVAATEQPATTVTMTPEPTATTAPTATAAPVPTVAPTAPPTTAPVATAEPTPALVPTQEAATAPVSTPDDATDSIGGLIADIAPVDGDGTQGSSSMLDSGKGATVDTSAGVGGGLTSTTGDGTQGGSTDLSGKGASLAATTATGLPATTGSGSSLIFPETPYQAAISASGAFSVILFATAILLRQGERRYAPGRWRRLGL